MKLLYLKLDKFRSIENFEHLFNSDESDICTPISFVGLNGSGKSNILEALTEIFSYLDFVGLDYKIPKSISKKCPFSFTIEYLININGNMEKVTIDAIQNRKLENIKKNRVESIGINDLHLYLPKNIISYSSGDNERISFSSMKNHTFYSAEIQRMAKQEIEDEFDEFYTERVRPLKSIFLDATLNNVIFAVNEIFVEDRRQSVFHKLLNEYINLKELRSFTINIKLGGVPLKRELLDIVTKLKICATVERGNIEKGLTLKFLLNNVETIQLLRSNFDTAMDLFSSLYKINLLNVLKLTASERRLYKSQEAQVLPKQSCISKEKKIFLLDDLKIKLTNNLNIDYIGLSDGEHQFMLILGMLNLFNSSSTLFLLDEPESHFNPQWRAKFVDIVSTVSPALRDNIILTTHSPYVVSACKKENVIKFFRDPETGMIDYLTSEKETFGDTFDGILHNIFDMRSKIPLYTSNYIRDVISSGNLVEMRQAVFNLAESPEKIRLYNAIYDLENQAN